MDTEKNLKGEEIVLGVAENNLVLPDNLSHEIKVEMKVSADTIRPNKLDILTEKAAEISLEPEDIVRCDGDDGIIENRKRPSTEILYHEPSKRIKTIGESSSGIGNNSGLQRTASAEMIRRWGNPKPSTSKAIRNIARARKKETFYTGNLNNYCRL